jgi:flagellar biosynthesis anti-sigma factor FlgM
MKISRSDPKTTAALNPSADVVPAGSAAPSKPGQQAAASDRVQLSSLNGHLASALSGSPAHAAKLSELDAALSSGQYHMDAYAVSGSLIQHSIEFGATGYLALRVGRR